MKTKKIFTLFVAMLFASVLSFNINAACGVSSDPENNTGHCRAEEGGGDTCFASGEGVACSHNVTIGPPKIQ